MSDVAMSKSWKSIIGFALLGLVVAGACYAYVAFYDYSKPMNRFDFAFVNDCFDDSLSTTAPFRLLHRLRSNRVGWFHDVSIVGALNAVLYAVIGALVVGLRKKQNDPL
jgi:hypothetical protein